MITKCPICTSGLSKHLGHKNRIPILACKDCTHVFADLTEYDINRDDPDLFRGSMTNGMIANDVDYYHHLVQGEAPGFPTEITTSKVLEIVNARGVTGGSWLDVGAGSGYLVQKAQHRGFDISGVEPGGWGQIAAERKNIRIDQAFFGDNLKGEKYTVVSATDVVEHVEDPVEFLTQMANHAEDTGVIVISVPCYDSFEAKALGLNWPMMAPPTHRQFFTKKSLQIAMEKARLRPLQVEQYNIRHIFGLSRHKIIRKAVDMVVRGDQLICMMALNVDN